MEMIFHFHENSFSQQNFAHVLASFWKWGFLDCRKWPFAESPTGCTDFARRVTPETKDQPVNLKMTEIQLDFYEEFFEDNLWVKRKAFYSLRTVKPKTKRVPG